MLTIIYGSDIDRVANYIKSKKASYKKENVLIYDYDVTTTDWNNILDVINSQNIFSVERKAIFIYTDLNLNNIKFTEEELQSLKDDDNVDVYIVCKSKHKSSNRLSISKNSNAYKIISKYSQIIFFDLPKDYKLFNLNDAILIEKNIQKSLNILNDFNNLDSEIFSIISTLQNTLRSYISYKYKNQTYKNLHPYVKKKISSVKLTKKEVDEVYDKLCELDFNLKSKNSNTHLLMQDFLIHLW